MRVETAGETLSIIRHLVGETYRVLECKQDYQLGNQHQKGPTCLWVAEEVTESWLRVSKQHCSLSDPSTTYSTTMQ